MARPTKEERLEEIATAALQSFSEQGYRLTQVADVAKRAGVAAGTIYLFAKSKEDLFWLALKLAVGKPLDGDGRPEVSAEFLRQAFAVPGLTFRLHDELADPRELPKLEVVLRNHWETLSHSARAIALVERCARDWPELAAAFYGDLRIHVVQDLADYLRIGATQGCCRQVPYPDLAARLIVETIAWFAMHRLGDVDGRNISTELAREATIDALIHAYGLPPETL